MHNPQIYLGVRIIETTKLRRSLPLLNMLFDNSFIATEILVNNWETPTEFSRFDYSTPRINPYSLYTSFLREN